MRSRLLILLYIQKKQAYIYNKKKKNSKLQQIELALVLKSRDMSANENKENYTES